MLNSHKMKEKRLIYFGIFPLMFFIVLYLLKFNKGLSDDSQEWNNFASYLSGLMMIVLTAINIYVFVKLTIAIDNSNEERRREEIKVQKLILLSNLRQNELNRFNEVLNNALMLKSSFPIDESTRTIIEAITYIETFVNTKKHLFSFIEDENFVDKISRLHNKLGLFNKKWIENIPKMFGAEKNDFLPTLFVEEDILEFLRLKNTVLSMLQDYTIKNLEY